MLRGHLAELAAAAGLRHSRATASCRRHARYYPVVKRSGTTGNKVSPGAAPRRCARAARSPETPPSPHRFIRRGTSTPSRAPPGADTCGGAEPVVPVAALLAPPANFLDASGILRGASDVGRGGPSVVNGWKGSNSIRRCANHQPQRADTFHRPRNASRPSRRIGGCRWSATRPRSVLIAPSRARVHRCPVTVLHFLVRRSAPTHAIPPALRSCVRRCVRTHRFRQCRNFNFD